MRQWNHWWTRSSIVSGWVGSVLWQIFRVSFLLSQLDICGAGWQHCRIKGRCLYRLFYCSLFNWYIFVYAWQDNWWTSTLELTRFSGSLINLSLLWNTDTADLHSLDLKTTLMFSECSTPSDVTHEVPVDGFIRSLDLGLHFIPPVISAKGASRRAKDLRFI